MKDVGDEMIIMGDRSAEDDPSCGAPIEILAEFLSAIMKKEYEAALKLCDIILRYEPNNATAQEFYPLLQEKILLTCDEEEEEVDESEGEEGSSSEASTGLPEDEEGIIDKDPEINDLSSQFQNSAKIDAV